MALCRDDIPGIADGTIDNIGHANLPVLKLFSFATTLIRDVLTRE